MATEVINAEWEDYCSDAPKLQAGISEDIENFIYAVYYSFDEDQAPRFQEFCQCWKARRMGLIFCGRDSFRETYEMTDIILQNIKQYVKPNKQDNDLIRYAALYSFYAFYFKQPCRPKVRIKLSYEEFLDLETLIKSATKDKHYDVLYAWSRLIANHAFQYSCVSRNLGIEVGKHMERKDPEDTLEGYSATSFLKSKVFKGKMRKLSLAHAKYMKTKEAVIRAHPDKMLSLNSADPNLIEAIEEISNQESKARLKERLRLKKSGDKELGEKRKMLKERSFRHEANTSQSSGHFEMMNQSQEENKLALQIEKKRNRQSNAERRKVEKLRKENLPKEKVVKLKGKPGRPKGKVGRPKGKVVKPKGKGSIKKGKVAQPASPKGKKVDPKGKVTRGLRVKRSMQSE